VEEWEGRGREGGGGHARVSENIDVNISTFYCLLFLFLMLVCNAMHIVAAFVSNSGEYWQGRESYQVGNSVSPHFKQAPLYTD